MARTIMGRFDTRREAETAVERLVQEYGFERTDIFIAAAEADNSAGVRAAGADVESGHPGIVPEGQPALHGRIEVSVDSEDNKVDRICAAFREFGASDIESR